MSALLTQAAYASHRGCSRAYVCQMVKRGKIPLTAEGKIDPAAADAALAAHADPDMAPVAAFHATQRQSQPSTPGAPPPPPKEPEEGGRYVETRLSRAKTEDAEYQAKQRKADYEKSIGLLVESAEVARAIAAIAPALNQLDTIPDRIIAPLRAAATDHAARELLMTELANFRQAVADFATAMCERMSVTPS